MSATAFGVFARASGLNKRMAGCLARLKLDDLLSIYDLHRMQLDLIVRVATQGPPEPPRRIKCMTFCDIIIDIAERQYPARSSADAVRLQKLCLPPSSRMHSSFTSSHVPPPNQPPPPLFCH